MKKMPNKQEKYISLFKDITNRFSQESKCAFIQVASIAVKNGRIIATGLNGTPSKTENCYDHFYEHWYHKVRYGGDTFDKWRKSQDFRDLHSQWSSVHDVHSEVSLITESLRNEISIEGCDIFSSYQPCKDCAKMLASIRVNQVLFINEYDKAYEESRTLLIKCGIPLIKI